MIPPSRDLPPLSAAAAVVRIVTDGSNIAQQCLNERPSRLAAAGEILSLTAAAAASAAAVNRTLRRGAPPRPRTHSQSARSFHREARQSLRMRSVIVGDKTINTDKSMSRRFPASRSHVVFPFVTALPPFCMVVLRCMYTCYVTSSCEPTYVRSLFTRSRFTLVMQARAPTDCVMVGRVQTDNQHNSIKRRRSPGGRSSVGKAHKGTSCHLMPMFLLVTERHR